VFNALDLNILEYANTDTEPTAWKIQKYQDVFKKYLVYRAFYDLKRGWRVNLPNLEQCALLTMDYEDLSLVAKSDKLWEDMLVLNNLSEKERCHFIDQVLEYFVSTRATTPLQKNYAAMLSSGLSFFIGGFQLLGSSSSILSAG
jgi:hypothetical protein